MSILITSILLSACDEETTEIPEKDNKPLSRIETGTIRGYFGNEYKIFNQHIENVATIDSFSNCFFYGTDLKQIDLIRCDSTHVIAIHIMGISPDSLPIIPVPQKFGRFTDIQFYDWDNGSSDIYDSRYILDDFYGISVVITKNREDVLSGRFEGTLRSLSGKTMRVSDGEFQIKIFRIHL